MSVMSYFSRTTKNFPKFHRQDFFYTKHTIYTRILYTRTYLYVSFLWFVFKCFREPLRVFASIITLHGCIIFFLIIQALNLYKTSDEITTLQDTASFMNNYVTQDTSYKIRLCTNRCDGDHFVNFLLSE